MRKEITRILNIANQNSNFLTLQTLEFQKKSDRNLWNRTRNRNSAYDGGPRNWNRKSEFPTKAKKLSNIKTPQGPSTHILGATSPDPNPYATSQVEELSYILSYQM
jgi:hypothetical protein